MTSPGRALVAGVDPEVVAAAVLACPAVAGLSGGAFGFAATYLPGRRVRGVVVREVASGGLPDLAVHVVARFGTPMTEVAGQVRAAVSAAAPGCRTAVHVDDLVLPGEDVPSQDDAAPVPDRSSAAASTGPTGWVDAVPGRGPGMPLHDPLVPPAAGRTQPEV